MNSFSRLFSKTFAAFSFFIVFLIALNLGLFTITFYGVIRHDYGLNSPSVMLDKTAETLTVQGISPDMEDPRGKPGSGRWLSMTRAGRQLSGASA